MLVAKIKRGMRKPMKKKEYSEKLIHFFRQSADANNYLSSYGTYLSELLARLDYKSVEKILGCLLEARERSSRIFFIGNGGSAATASHFAQDFAEIGRKTGTRCFRTLSLTDNAPFITALANDYGYENIFKCQMEESFKKKDILVAISASGNSASIIKAVDYARQLGGITIGFVGFDGGRLGKICDYTLHINTGLGEYGPVEDIHLILGHMISSYFICHQLAESKRIKWKKRKE